MLDDDGRFVDVSDLPVTPVGRKGRPQLNGRLFAERLQAILQSTTKCDTFVIVEDIGPRPKQGVSSMFRFGVSLGVILGVLGALELPFLMVPPTRWKKAAGLGKDKDESRTLALRYWPEAAAFLQRKKDNNRSDALLLARFGFTQGRGAPPQKGTHDRRADHEGQPSRT